MYRLKTPYREGATADITDADIAAAKLEGKVPWITSAMAQAAHMRRETYLLAVARENLIYVIFWLNLTFISLAMVDPYMFWMTDAIRGQMAMKKFRAEFANMRFDDIRCAGDFWHYMHDLYPEVIFVDKFFETPGEKKADVGILYFNKLIGTPSIRQVNVKNNSCTTHPRFRRAFLVCYDSYHSGSMSKIPIPSHGLGSPENSAFKWQSEDDLEGTSHYGRVSIYDGSGFFIKLGRSKRTVRKTVEALKKGMWFRRETRAIFVDTTVYNPHVNLFCNILIVFELPPTGGILPNMYFRTIKLLRYFSILDYIILGCEVVYVCFVLYYLAEEIREAAFLKFYYLLMFWTYIDVTIVVASIAYFVLLIHQHIAVDDIMDRVQKSITNYNSFVRVAENELAIRNTQAICLFVASIKLFRFLNVNRIMEHLTRTIKNSAKDVVGFSVMFFLIFISFAELGYLIFGTQVTAFSGFGTSMFTLLRTMLGDFDYNEIQRAHKVLAPIFFILFIFLVFFVLLNMFLAIINDTYSDVKSEMDVEPRKLEMTQFWRRGCYNMITDCGCGACTPRILIKMSDDNATVEEIRKVLKRCGYSDVDIDTFLSRYNVDRDVEVRARDVSELIEAMRDPIEQAAAIAAAAAQAKKEAKEPEQKPTRSDVPPIIPMEEFVAQQTRLDKIEAVMTVISDKLEMLLKHLTSLDNVRKY